MIEIQTQPRVVYVERERSGCLKTGLLIGCVVPMSLLLLVFVAMFVVRLNNPELDKQLREETKKQDDLFSAFYTAKQAVKQQLKFPEEADFGNQTSIESVKALDNGTYAVSGWVISKNAFGVKSRYIFSVNVRKEGSKWIAKPASLYER